MQKQSQDEEREDFIEMATSAITGLGIPEDEAELLIDDYLS